MKRWPRIVLILCALASAGSLHAENSGAQFLTIPVNPRALGLGSGIVALGDDVGSLTSNPAGLGHLRAKELGMLYAPHVEGMDLGYLAYAHPTAYGAFGLSCLTMRSGALDGRDDAGGQTSSFSAEDRALTLSFGRAFTRGAGDQDGFMRVGGSVKYITSRIASYRASAYAADAGIQFPLQAGPVPLTLGAVVRNMGSGVKFLDRTDPLPLNAAFAAAVRPLDALVFTAGFTRSFHEKSTQYSVGGEFSPASMVTLRSSFNFTRALMATGSTLPSLAGGIGFKWRGARLDYAFAPMGDLGSTQRVSITLRFGASVTADPSALRLRPKPRIGNDFVIPVRSQEAVNDEWRWRQAWVY